MPGVAQMDHNAGHWEEIPFFYLPLDGEIAEECYACCGVRPPIRTYDLVAHDRVDVDLPRSSGVRCW